MPVTCKARARTGLEDGRDAFDPATTGQFLIGVADKSGNLVVKPAYRGVNQRYDVRTFGAISNLAGAGVDREVTVEIGRAAPVCRCNEGVVAEPAATRESRSCR
jgi:hypothetical protein